MANIIKIKRGSGVPASGVLSGYELGWDYTNDSLYLGVEGSDPLKIADAFAGYLTINKSTGKLYATTALEVDGAVDFNSTLTVDGNTLLSGTLTTTGLATFNGGIQTDTGAFTVADTSGNVYTAGTLTVDGSTVLGDSSDDTAIIRGNVTLSDTSRTTAVLGTFEVDGATGLDGDVRVGSAGSSKLTIASATGNLSTTGTLDVSGAASFSSTLGVVGIATLSNDVNIGADLYVAGNSDVTGNSVVDGNVEVGGTLEVTGNSTISSVTASGLASLDGGVDVNSNLTINTDGDVATSGNITAQDATFNGNLTVHGTTTTVNSTTVEISDPIFTLGETLATSDAKDRGIEFNYGSTANPYVGFFGLDESTGRFVFLPDATNTSEVFSGNQGDFEVGEIYQPQTDGAYAPAGAIVNASANWNAAAVALGISGGTGGITSGVQYDLLQADSNGVFQPTKTISEASGITIDCGSY